MAKKKEAATDLRITVAHILHDLLDYILRSGGSKPADPKAWEALGRLDQHRRALQREMGAETTEMHDPHGRVSYDKEGGGEATWDTAPSSTT